MPCLNCHADLALKRSTKNYCSQKCKQTAYRNRKKEAIVTVREIVTLTVTDKVCPKHGPRCARLVCRHYGLI